MKKIVVVLGVVLLGAGVYFGYYGVQRMLINARLNTVIAECNPELLNQRGLSPEMKRLREQLCAVVEEENEAARQAARTSKTEKEFEQKLWLLAEQETKENRIGKIVEQMKALKQRSNRN